VASGAATARMETEEGVLIGRIPCTACLRHSDAHSSLARPFCDGRYGRHPSLARAFLD